LIHLLTGCETVAYYGQAAHGQFRLIQAREPVDKLLSGPLAEQLRGRLEFSQGALGYIEANLGLNPEKRYQTYVELDREYVLWNVFVAPEFSTHPKRWCYPIAGCAAYRGYFSQIRAKKTAELYKSQGFDVYVGGVAAYSTLGWFEDSLLSSFIHSSDDALFKLLAHELAHSRIWVSGEVAFNEAFATFVGQQGLADWRADSERESLQNDKLTKERQQALDLLFRLRARLQVLYQASLDDAQRRLKKAELIAASRACYDASKGRYSSYFERPINNASLAIVSRYWQLVPWFAELFAATDNQWEEFYSKVEAIVSSGVLPELKTYGYDHPIVCAALFVE
jgi:predicted aminopeptidase